MTASQPDRQEIIDAAFAGDLDRLEQLARAGADFNQPSPCDEEPLEEVVDHFCFCAPRGRGENWIGFRVVRKLIELGANPDPDPGNEASNGALYAPSIHADEAMLRLLLEAGADPNRHRGFDPGETVYDMAEDDYWLDTYVKPGVDFPEKPTDEDWRNEDTWLAFLDRMAVLGNRRRPSHLFLLRAYGARRGLDED